MINRSPTAKSPPSPATVPQLDPSRRYEVWFPLIQGLLDNTESEIRHRLDDRTSSVLQITGTLPYENMDRLTSIQRGRYLGATPDTVLIAGFWWHARLSSMDVAGNNNNTRWGMAIRVDMEFVLYPLKSPTAHPVLTLRRRIGRGLK